MSTLSKDILFGLSVADAIGLPIEFKYPNQIDIESVKSNYADQPNRAQALGYWLKPIGTFSDDSSLTFCTAEYLANNEKDLNKLMERFADWLKEGYWTADGETFDVGRTTLFSIENYIYGSSWKDCGLKSERDNGNGSLMRIAPLLLPLLFDNSIKDPFQYISQFSSLTHGHPIAINACYIYLTYAKHLYLTKNVNNAYEKLKNDLGDVYRKDPFFARIFTNTFISTETTEFNNRGFVVGSLEIALHTMLTTQSYQQAILQVMSIGKDTDTNGAITGALAGLLYGYKSIPSSWLEPLKQKEAIEALAIQLDKQFNEKTLL